MSQFLIRSVDIMSAAVGLVILSPVLILISIVLKFTGEGEVLYLQVRNHEER